jgi:pilus assembly protein CpaE
MTESPSEIDYLTTLLFARSDVSQRIMATMNMISEKKVRIAVNLPLFDLENATQILNQLAPQVVMVDADVEGYSLQELMSLKQHSALPFLIVGLAQAGTSALEEMISVGIDAAFPLPLTDNALIRMEFELVEKYKSVARAWGKGAWGAAAPDAIKAATAAAGGSPWKQQAIAVWSPKGGVGKTVLACELAATLAALGGRSVALIDANMNGGHIKLRLNVDSPQNILHAASTYHTHKGHPSLESDAIKKVQNMLMPLPGTENLKVMVGVANMRQSTNENVLGEKGLEFARWLINILNRKYDFVIVDVGSSINVGVHLGVIQEVDFVIAVCEPDLTSLADVKEGVHRSIIARMGIDINRFGLVINKWQDNLGVSLKEAAKYAGVSAMGIIPNDATGNVTRAGNSGHSYVAKFANRKDNSKETEATLNGFAQLAGQFYSPILAAWGERMKQKRKKGLLGRG